MTNNTNKEFFDNNFGKIAGNVTKDVQAKTSRHGKVYAHFSIANHAGNNTRFFNGVAWGDHAKNLAKIGKKGNKLNIRYHLGTDKFTLKNGKVLHLTELVISGQHEGAKLIQMKSNKQNKTNNDQTDHSDNSNPFAKPSDSDKTDETNPFAA